MPYLSEHLGSLVAELNYSDLPESITNKAKLCLLDATGCLAAAHQSPLASIVENYIAGICASTELQPSSISIPVDPATRAGAYALLINALDYDDIYWKGHPGATVNATALSMALTIELSGSDVILAIVAGYEVSGRVAMSLGHSAPRKTVHGHGTWQIFGAAAAAAKLLNLDAWQTAHALAIAAANAPVPSVMKTVYGDQPSLAKNNFGTAAQAGVTAAYLARAGMEGPLDVFEGDTGFWRMAGAEKCDSTRLSRRFGEPYEINDVGFKAFSCCRIIQACAEAARAAMNDADVADEDAIDLIVAAVPEIACREPFSIERPMTMSAAQFSVPYAIVATILRIPPGPEWFTRETLTRITSHPLVDKILLRPRRLTAYHGAEVSLSFADGRSTNSSVDIATGDAAAPLSSAFLFDKFMRLASETLGEAGAESARGAIMSLEDPMSMAILTQPIARSFIS